MRPIPASMKKELEQEPRMKQCTLQALGPLYGRCDTGRPEWHHVWIYAGRQINEKWAILSACHYHHILVTKDKAIRQAFEVASLMLATVTDLAAYPRKDWLQIKRSLGMKR